MQIRVLWTKNKKYSFEYFLFIRARDGTRTLSSLANPVNTRRTAHCLLSVYKLSTNISKRLIDSKIYQPFYSSFFSINLSKLTSNATEIL